MTTETIIRQASLAGLDLNVRDGQLYAHPRNPIPDDLLVTVTAHKTAILHYLTVYHTIRTLAVLDMRRCLPLSPNDLAPSEIQEAHALADELRTSGGLGQFVCDLWERWNQVSEHDRLAAVCAWHLAADFPITGGGTEWGEPLTPTETDQVWRMVY